MNDGGIERRPLGRTGLQVSSLGLGGMGVISDRHKDARSAAEVILAAIDGGINFIDTARGYFDSEKIIGEALQQRPGHQVIIATKTYMRKARDAEAEINRSLKELQIPKIHLLQVHHLQYQREFDEITSPGGAMEALKWFRKNRIIDHIGVSSHNPEILPSILKSDLFDTVQFPLNPAETDHYDRIKETAEKLNLGTIVMKPLAGGGFKSVREALVFALSHNVSTVIPGCSTVEQVRFNIETARSHKALDENERQALTGEARNLPDQFCRRCRYCERECPAGIPISDIFRCENYLILSATYAREEHRKLPASFSRCRDCGKCEEICPYNLPVREMLKRANKRLKRGLLEDAAVKVLRKAGLYDLARKAYFALGGKLPER